MPLTQPQIDQINAVLLEINEKVQPIVRSQTDMMALLRIHGDIDHAASLVAVIATAKLQARTAANDLVAFLDAL